MSDLDDLQKLREQLDAGKITAEEYERERAWITGGTIETGTSPAKAARTSQTSQTAKDSAKGHVIDLHEIEDDEPASKEPARKARKEQKERKSIPTVWKVILVAFVVWILLIITAVLYLRLRGNQGGAAPSAQETAATQTQQGSETAQNAADELQGTQTTETSYEAFLDQLEATLGTYYADHYSITDDGKTLTISLTGDGIAADAMYVVEGVDGAAEIWTELKASMQSLAGTCFEGANAGEPSRHVVLNILNDQNEENAILSYLDGTCIYDATEN